MLKVKEGMLKRVIGLLLSLVLFSCDGRNALSSNVKDEINVIIDMRLPIDANGYYHLELERNNWQTLHRVSGSVFDYDNYPIENCYIQWESNLYWYLGDTLGYIINRHFSDQGQYVSIDTSYIVGFTGIEVPTSNMVSYSNRYGEINNIIAPVRSMIGDTLVLSVYWSDYNYDVSIEKYGIVLD